MPWMLNPHNYVRASRPNLYNMSYRRVGAYKGMGQPASTDSTISYPGEYSGYELSQLPPAKSSSFFTPLQIAGALSPSSGYNANAQTAAPTDWWTWATVGLGALVVLLLVSKR